MVVSERKNDPAVSSPLALMTIAELPPGVSLAVARPMYHRLAHRSRTIRNERTTRLLYPSGDYDRAMAVPTIVAMGGGTLDQPYDPTREHFIFSLARRTRPRVAFLGTASGDSEAYTANFFRSVGGLECDATDLPLFQRREAELRRIVLALDVIYVGGGNTLSLLAVWRAHRLDELLREAWEEGIVLCGVSAGMNCWFEQSMTDSFAVGTTQVLDDGLGFLSGSACPHYDEDPTRRPAYRTAVARGEVSPGYAADGAAALVFHGSQLEEVVSWSENATGYRLEPGENGEATEQALPARRLAPAQVRSPSRVT